ncbi:MAG: dihydroorotate dehydrogenase electron transfer subunit [Muribaculaceae bacterium]|nr:dihydroorotate dehydrogenase electron transfer subunit [Muribaculaceae bacterium]MDE5976190.1 dihydroorotate dehydrogenase electron transfer subunit [Muribaculaceae bacterium]MDE6298549.1 dihydroorotate dehydrogenase electron transfer subunit [Muribaculaceae bacterium]
MTKILNDYTLLSNRPLTHKTWVMTLRGDTQAISAPGQFVNVAIPGKYLRRPISICDFSHERGEIVLLYDVVGEGTLAMSRMKEGEKVNMLSGLGNGFSTTSIGSRPLLLGGGIGCAPLLNLGRALVRGGKQPIAILGYNTAADSFGMDRWFEEIGIEAYIATVDGSVGTKGFVTDVISNLGIEGDYFHACGPMPMLRALCTGLDIPGEVSIESRMGCGFGACVCCSVETADGVKRICKDGPVFRKEELIWK